MNKDKRLPIDKAIENLESSFLLWDDKTLKEFVEAVVKKWNLEGGYSMKNKGLCARCIHDKDCDYPRKFPVHACDDFTPGKNNGYEETQKWSEKE